MPSCIDLGAQGWLLRLRSTGPQAFDVTSAPDAAVLVVRLHGARLGALAELPETAIGALKLRARAGGVELRLGRPGGARARVAQGPNPSEVEIRVAP